MPQPIFRINLLLVQAITLLCFTIRLNNKLLRILLINKTKTIFIHCVSFERFEAQSNTAHAMPSLDTTLDCTQHLLLLMRAFIAACCKFCIPGTCYLLQSIQCLLCLRTGDVALRHGTGGGVIVLYMDSCLRGAEGWGSCHKMGYS